jgi:uncharacterized membrane protein
VIWRAARRFAALLLLVGGGTVAVGAILGVVAGTSGQRGAAVGLYAVGGVSTVLGALLVTRNSVQLRRMSAESDDSEVAESSRELAGILLALGIILVVLGIAVDPQARLI